jgi:phage-related protein
MSHIYDINKPAKAIRIHKKVHKEIQQLDFQLRRELTELFILLSEGEKLSLPKSRPMPSVTHGSHELRLKDSAGQYRIFYYTKNADAILVFHFFKKQTQKTPDLQIATARSRLREML